MVGYFKIPVTGRVHSSKVLSFFRMTSLWLFYHLVLIRFSITLSDLLLGRIFGYLVVQQAGYFRSSECLSNLETVVQGLLEALDGKAYLQDVAASTLACVIIDVDK